VCQILGQEINWWVPGAGDGVGDFLRRQSFLSGSWNVECTGTRQRLWLHNIVNVLNGNELYPQKWLNYMNFTSIKNRNWPGNVTQVVEHLPRKLEAWF
jgi:hypothetical protein